MEASVRIEERDGVGIIRLNRPEVLNALTVPMLRVVSAALRDLGSSARGIVLTGAGRAFSSGDDLDATEDLDVERFAELIDGFQDVTRAILETNVVVVAGVNGIAVGGAAEIACACDVRVGGPASAFLFPENGLGLTISNGSSLLLRRLLGERARALVLLGERIPADRALALGLLDTVVEGDVEEEARRIAAQLGGEERSTSIHLSLLRPGREEVEAALQAERQAAMQAWERGLPQEGVRRFLEGRRSR